MPDVETLFRELIVRHFPRFSSSHFTMMHHGWDCIAVDVDGEWIFKFPRHESAIRALEKEARLLEIVRPLLSVTVPDLRVYAGDPVFSGHRKIPGEHLLSEDYARLSGERRQRLAEEIGRFYHELHQLDPREMIAEGTPPIGAWPKPRAILRDLKKALLEPPLLTIAGKALERWKNLGSDPLGEVYGFFDGHGWNMAFDRERGHLNGIYDFADSGIGEVHREFIYTDFIDRDLTWRVADVYETLSGKTLDRERIDLLSGVLALSELAGNPDHELHGGMIRQRAADFLGRWEGETD